MLNNKADFINSMGATIGDLIFQFCCTFSMVMLVLNGLDYFFGPMCFVMSCKEK